MAGSKNGDAGKRAADAAEWYVRAVDVRGRMYDWFARAHVDWIQARREERTRVTFKEFAAERAVTEAAEARPDLSVETLKLIAAAMRGHVEEWYG